MRIYVCLLALLTLALTQNAAAQILYGSIVGNVRDSSGAAVPGAVVTITNRDTNQSRQTQTNSGGLYTFSTVPSGTYDVSVAKEGFQAYSTRGLVVTINSIARADAALQLGAVTESVNVQADALVLQTDRTEVRTEMVSKTLVNVPVVGARNFQKLFVTVPGFTPPTNAHSVPSNPSRALRFNVNGATAASVDTRIDGASSFNVWLPHMTAYVPALESIDTVNIVSGSMSPEQGLAGGASINVQIKSGSNEVHGSGFWYHTDNALKAKPFFFPLNQNKPKYVFNQMGGTVGGPIKKDRIFFFLSYEGSYDRQFASRFGQVPTTAMKGGDLSASNRPIHDPLTGTFTGAGRTPFPGNIIPASRISPITKKIIDRIPNPLFTDFLQNNYFTAGSYAFDRKTLDTKFNFNLTDKWTSYVRWSLLDYTMDNAPMFGDTLVGPAISGAGGNVGLGFGKTASVTLATTYVATPTLIFDGYFGYTLMDTNVEQPLLDKNVGTDELGIPGVNGTRRFEGGWPRFTFGNGFTTLGVPDAFMPYNRSDPQFQYVANGNWTKGQHNVRFGFQFYRQNLNHAQPEFPGASHGAQGGFNFSGGPTQIQGGPSANEYNTFGSFLLGYPSNNGRILQVDDEYKTRASMFNMYVSDKWSVTPRLTLTYGLRWEYFPMPTRGDRGLERYDFANNKMLVCGVGQVPRDCGTTVSKKNFAPSLGVAWRPTDRTVLRAGFGINWDPFNLARPLRTNFPILLVHNGVSPNSLMPVGTEQLAGGGFRLGTIADGIPTLRPPDLGNGIIDIPASYAVLSTGDEFKRSYIASWNVSLQRQLGGGFVGQVGYVASRTIRRLMYYDLNAERVGGGRASRPFNQRFGRTVQTSVIAPIGRTNYDSLQAMLERRFSNGFQMSLSYTYSATIGVCCNNNSDGGPSVQIPEYFGLNYARLNEDIPHNFQAMGLYELPFGKGRKYLSGGGIGGAIIGGWQINGLLSLIQGTPFTVSSDGASLNAAGNGQRADLVGDGEVKRLGGIGRGQPYYDWTRFRAVTEPRFGTAGLNILRGPGVANLDVGLFRSFDITERFLVQFRAEAFNLTNTPHFNTPSANISNLRVNSDGTFQQGVFEVTGIRNTGREGIDERVFRLGLRLQF